MPGDVEGHQDLFKYLSSVLLGRVPLIRFQAAHSGACTRPRLQDARTVYTFFPLFSSFLTVSRRIHIATLTNR